MSSKIILERNVPVKMRDGVTLYADIYRPDKEGKFPTIMQRLPYDKQSIAVVGMFLNPTRAVESGYVVIAQDVRGRFTSEGDYNPLFQERKDGYDTIEWCAKQSWCDGNIGTYGLSYIGAFQWLAAIERPPHLKAMIPGLTPSNYNEGWIHHGGAFELGFLMSWGLNWKAPPQLIRDDPNADLSDLINAVNNIFDYSFKYLPLNEFPELKKGAPWFYEWLNHPDENEYWDYINIEKNHKNIEVPALNLGAWYDIFLQGTINNYVGMKKNGPTEKSRQQELLIGPWSHLDKSFPLYGNMCGDVEFGLEAAWYMMDMEGIALKWFDKWLKNDGGDINEYPVKIFVMGENKWRPEKEWPLKRTQYINYYFHSNGNANSNMTEGTLNTTLPQSEPNDRYAYDPMNPVPTIGGSLCCDTTHMPGGPYDQRPLESRNDVLIYTTETLTEDIEVTGRIIINLWASSSAIDTDFTGKLVEVTPCGYAKNLQDGIIRARYRNSRKTPELLTSNKIYNYELDLWSTSNLFKKGHKIRVEISSSNFPRFDRNLNTGKIVAEEKNPIIATQNIYHNKQYPSHIVLPIIPKKP